jgi:cation diffusion facilitator CzcD-associated flavoprotein CzcO
VNQEADAGTPQRHGNFPRVVIIGAGISGICLAIRLQRAGMESIRILEKSNDVGGTWLDNTYPGCGCDVASILYSFSFAPKYDWSRKFAPQSEILQYFRDCADRFGVRKYIRFGTEVSKAVYDEASGVWRVRTTSGEELEADILVSAVGQLNLPKVPHLKGLDRFHGPAFHSARWDHGFDIRDRRIAIVGSGASAVQLIPKIAETARQVVIFQRTANWIGHRYDYGYSSAAQWAFRWIPGIARLHRSWQYLTCELRILLYQRRTLLNKGFSAYLMKQMLDKAPEHLHKAILPQYPAGCKRVLISNDYLETFHRDNVRLVTEPIREVTADAVVAGDETFPVDAIVLATGFQSSKFLYPMTIVGRDNVRLNDIWQQRPTTYLGMTCTGFPNFFMLYGPNTNLGHNSIIFMIECQVHYLIACLKEMKRRNRRRIEVREEAMQSFDRQLQKELQKKVWNGYVASWYRTEEGHIVNNWSGSTLSYYWKTRNPDFRHFEFGAEDRRPLAEETPASAG